MNDYKKRKFARQMSGIAAIISILSASADGIVAPSIAGGATATGAAVGHHILGNQNELGGTNNPCSPLYPEYADILGPPEGLAIEIARGKKYVQLLQTQLSGQIGLFADAVAEGAKKDTLLAQKISALKGALSIALNMAGPLFKKEDRIGAAIENAAPSSDLLTSLVNMDKAVEEAMEAALKGVHVKKEAWTADTYNKLIPTVSPQRNFSLA